VMSKSEWDHKKGETKRKPAKRKIFVRVAVYAIVTEQSDLACVLAIMHN